MAEITFPDDLQVGQQRIGQRTYEIADVSAENGDAAYRVSGPPRWSMSVVSKNNMDAENGGRWEAVIAALRGGVNHLAIYDRNKPLPVGTARGTQTLAAQLVAGATSATINGVSPGGANYKRGDWLQLGTGLGSSQTVKVAADATASGSTIAITFEPPIRQGLTIASGSAVRYDKPLIYMRRADGEASWEAVPGTTFTQGHTINLLETFRA